jgi:D-alanyl-D-alanine carboxypeptidase
VKTVAALGVVAALAVLPGERPRPAAPRPAPECTVFQAEGPIPDGAAAAVAIDAETGRVLYRLPTSDDGALVTFAMICPD